MHTGTATGASLFVLLVRRRAVAEERDGAGWQRGPVGHKLADSAKPYIFLMFLVMVWHLSFLSGRAGHFREQIWSGENKQKCTGSYY